MSGEVAAESLPALGDWISNHAPRRSLPYRFVASASTDALRGLLAADLLGSTGRIFTLPGAEAPAALVRIQSQPWDSSVLSVPAYSLNAWLFAEADEVDAGELAALVRRALDSVTRPGEPAMVAAKCWVSDIPLVHAFERNGFLLMDTAVDVVRDRATAGGKGRITSAQPEGFALRLATRDDIAALRDLATKAFAQHFGRFHSDPRIGRERATGIYADWIAACVEGWADFVFLAEEVPTRAVAGFSAWKKPSERAFSLDLALAHYSIGAVSPDFSGRGLFKSLTLAGMEALGPDVAIEGPTHLHNLAVQRGYLALGWKIADSRQTFHAWLE